MYFFKTILYLQFFLNIPYTDNRLLFVIYRFNNNQCQFENCVMLKFTELLMLSLHNPRWHLKRQSLLKRKSVRLKRCDTSKKKLRRRRKNGGTYVPIYSHGHQIEKEMKTADKRMFRIGLESQWYFSNFGNITLHKQ